MSRKNPVYGFFHILTDTTWEISSSNQNIKISVMSRKNIVYGFFHILLDIWEITASNKYI